MLNKDDLKAREYQATKAESHAALVSQGKGEVSHFSDERAASRLMSMGVLPGSVIELVRRAPFGGGWYVKVDGLLLALRDREVNCILVKS
jgi:ferrous iron transport protein A